MVICHKNESWWFSAKTGVIVVVFCNFLGSEPRGSSVSRRFQTCDVIRSASVDDRFELESSPSITVICSPRNCRAARRGISRTYVPPGNELPWHHHPRARPVYVDHRSVPKPRRLSLASPVPVKTMTRTGRQRTWPRLSSTVPVPASPCGLTELFTRRLDAVQRRHRHRQRQLSRRRRRPRLAPERFTRSSGHGARGTQDRSSAVPQQCTAVCVRGCLPLTSFLASSAPFPTCGL